MPKYNTKKRQLLLSFLAEHPDELISARRLAGALPGISRSAVYRNLAELEAQGAVRRETKSRSKEAYYQYTAAESCKERLHLSCKNCGKTFHLDDGATELLEKNLVKSGRFELDRGDTVLYGFCDNCQRRKKEQ